LSGAGHVNISAYKGDEKQTLRAGEMEVNPVPEIKHKTGKKHKII
jgi:hypothetical protein